MKLVSVHLRVKMCTGDHKGVRETYQIVGVPSLFGGGGGHINLALHVVPLSFRNWVKLLQCGPSVSRSTLPYLSHRVQRIDSAKYSKLYSVATLIHFLHHQHRLERRQAPLSICTVCS